MPQHSRITDGQVHGWDEAHSPAHRTLLVNNGSGLVMASPAEAVAHGGDRYSDIADAAIFGLFLLFAVLVWAVRY
ncbi:hypothetical protein [Azospirillum sp.]|uniref:hypothetical protein n=1 Tax=Azospirillum sp. TaxID=34012 RepID=UPI003D73FF02